MADSNMAVDPSDIVLTQINPHFKEGSQTNSRNPYNYVTSTSTAWNLQDLSETLDGMEPDERNTEVYTSATFAYGHDYRKDLIQKDVDMEFEFEFESAMDMVALDLQDAFADTGTTMAPGSETAETTETTETERDTAMDRDVDVNTAQPPPASERLLQALAHVREEHRQQNVHAPHATSRTSTSTSTSTSISRQSSRNPLGRGRTPIRNSELHIMTRVREQEIKRERERARKRARARRRAEQDDTANSNSRHITPQQVAQMILKVYPFEVEISEESVRRR